MKLYHTAASPFVRKVMVLLNVAGATDRVTLIPAAVSPLKSDALPIDSNPLGKIPALETDDGVAIYDSRVITRYLDEVLKAGLYPPAPRLWETLTLEATADGLTEAAVLIRYEFHIRPEGSRSHDWAEGQWHKIDRALTAVETRWMAHLSGSLDMGQIALGCALGYLDFRHPERDWRQSRPALAAWSAAFADRPAMLATAPGR